MIKLKAPEDATALSIGGVEQAIVNGSVEVADHLAEELRAHGFMPAKRDKKTAAKPAQEGE